MRIRKSDNNEKKNKYVNVDDFKNNPNFAIEKYKSNLQFIYQNPIQLIEIKTIVGHEYEIWIKLYNDNIKIKKEVKQQFNKLPNFSYEQLLFFYSLFISCCIYTDKSIQKKYVEKDFLYNLNYFLKRIPKNKITEYNNEKLLATEILPQFSEINKNLSDLENFTFMCNVYANGVLLNKSNNNEKYVLYQKEFMSYENNMYIEELEIINNKEYKDFEYLELYNLILTIIKNKYDWDFKCINTNYIEYNFGLFFYIINSFTSFEEISPHSLLITSNIDCENEIYNNLDNLKRIKYKDLKTKINSTFSSFSNFREDNIDLLIGKLGTSEFNTSKQFYPLFKIEEYVYINSECFPAITDPSFADYLFSLFWKNSNVQERKNYSTIFEDMVYKVFKDKAYNFSAEKNVKYSIDNKIYEIDVIARNEKTIIICEVKSTDTNYYFSEIEKNIRNTVNGKAKHQLHRMKKDFNNQEVLKQINISKDDFEKKEIVYMIVSPGFDGVGQVDGIVSVNLFLLDFILSDNISSNIKIKESYENNLKKILFAAKNGLEYKINYT